MAEPVLLISSDPFLGASLEAVARGRLQIARLDPARRPPAWPASPSATVVLDVTARQRDPVHTWVRRHHAGPLVILLKPGERQPPVPPGPSTTVVARPFRLIELVALLERPPTPPAAREGDAEAVDAEGEREGEGEPPPVPPGAAGRLPRPDWPMEADPAGRPAAAAARAAGGAGGGPAADAVLLGVDGPRRYLAVLTSPDEPLAVREVVVEADAAATTSTALAKPGADPAIDLHG